MNVVRCSITDRVAVVASNVNNQVTKRKSNDLDFGYFRNDRASNQAFDDQVLPCRNLARREFHRFMNSPQRISLEQLLISEQK